MPRVHLFEIEDQTWCPQSIREMTTDFLLGLYTLTNLFEPAFQKIIEVLEKTNTKNIIDCCSGSGGTIRFLREYLNTHGKQDISITLTDKYPNIKSFSELELLYPQSIVGIRDSIDASQLPVSLQGMRTFFSSFHHFAPDQALKILQDAVSQNAPIAIFESTQRQFADFVRVLLSPLMMMFVTPFARRMTLTKFILTYIIPITPFITMWDYLVSNLRTYSSVEMRTLINQLDAPGYHWEYGQLWSKKALSYVPYLIGYKT